jgi:two-component system NtrC family sensor kinase
VERNGGIPEGSLAGEGPRLALESALDGRSSGEPPASLLVRSNDGRALWRNASFSALEAELEVNQRPLGALFASVAAPAQGELCCHGGTRLHWRVLPFQWPGEGEAQLWIFDDVSRQVSTQQALDEARGKLRLLSAHTKGILFEFDSQARFVRVWASDPSLLARPESELLGHNLLEALGPEMGKWHHARVCHTLLTGEEQAYEYTLPVPSGSRNFACTSVAVPSPDGARRGAVFWIRDITEEVELRSQLQRADRLAAVGTLAAGVAHEINNPLGYMRLNLEHVRRELLGLSAATQLSARLGPLMRPLEMVSEGAERVHKIVAALLNLARASDTHQLVDVRQTLERCLEVAAHEFAGRVRIQRDYGAAPHVTANELRLTQVFANLLSNAAEAMADGRTDHTLSVSLRTDARGRAVAEIRDSGPGIAREHLQRVFDPFFTTKESGLGLGLAICQRIVSSFGGEIDVESLPGAGALFRVALPAAVPTPEPLPAEPAVP